MLRDPLVHFAVLAALIFGVYAMTHKKPVVVAGSVDQARDEVLYREALARGFADEDARVKQRLVVRMQRALLDPIEPPTDEQLVDFYATHLSLFTLDKPLPFTEARSAVFDAWVVAQGEAQLAEKTRGLMERYDVTIRQP